MMIRAVRHLCIILCGLPAITFAQASASDPTGASGQGDVAVTLYNDILALMQDIRSIAIPAGIARIKFPDVSAQIRPETLSFAADGAASSSRIWTSTSCRPPN
ncbi:hypothetical protein WG907_15930 [Sphingobium sp. AN558]|uniref:hypothetical protein n=1 Tax=Sphingobium sp. AN558 TaxID=3133442 RepID=UPI0030C6063E